jgi:hypothetical protein
MTIARFFFPKVMGCSIILCLVCSLFLLRARSSQTPAKDPTQVLVPTGENAYCAKGNVPEFGEYDGPAELPKTCYYTALDATPSPGSQIKVAEGSDLGEALNRAKCGDTLLLAAGAGFPLREFPRKNCDDQHYITVRTDAPDSDLPPEGTRISPAWAGVASLPGRPAYAQPPGGAAKRMAAIETIKPTGLELGDHYRFIGIEWRPANSSVLRLLFTRGGDHLIFDRNWMHGGNYQELVAGLGIAQGGTYIAVIHSYMSDFLCIAVTGRCTDAKAIGAGGGDGPMHTVKVFDNFLEAAGENILLGGAEATYNAEDFEIRRNHFFKPPFWNPNSVDHRQPTPIVKNIFEAKSANRVLLEANYLENSWGGFTQVGSAIVLTPRNGANKKKGQPNNCPKCEVTNITIRYDWVRKVNQLLLIGNPEDSDSPAPGNHYSFHDIVVEGLRYPECGKACGGAQNLVSGGGAGMPTEAVMHDVSVRHITFVSMSTPHSLFILNGPPKGAPPGTQMYNISWTDTLADVGVYGAFPTGGGNTNCSSIGVRATPAERLKECWKDSEFKGNVLAVSGAARPEAGEWPAGNHVVGDQKSIGYVNLNNGLDGDYHLAASSKFKGKATDGKDPGADVDAVLAAISGVR